MLRSKYTTIRDTPSTYQETHEVIMASGIARGRVRTTATTAESRKMAAILQVNRDMQPWHLSKHGIRLPVSRDHIAGSSLELIEADQVLVFDWKFFLYTNDFHNCSFVYFEVIQTQNRRPNNIQKTSPQSYKTQIVYPVLHWEKSDGMYQSGHMNKPLPQPGRRVHIGNLGVKIIESESRCQKWISVLFGRRP